MDHDEDQAPDWRAARGVELPTILACALEAFHELGYHGTSVRQIAGRVGVTVPALYYHYENKERILFSLLDSSITHIVRHCQAAFDEPTTEPGGQFLHVVEFIVRFQATNAEISYLDSEARLLGTDLRRQYVAKRDEVERLTRAGLEVGVSEGVFDVPDLGHTTRAVLGMIQALSSWYRPDGELTVDELAALYVHLVAETVGASDDVLARTSAAIAATRAAS